LFEEVVRSRIVLAEVEALDAAKEAGLHPAYKGKTEAKLAEAALWRDFLTKFNDLSLLDGLFLSQPTTSPRSNHV